MNLVSVIVVTTFSAAFAMFHSCRALKARAITPGDLAMYGAAIFLAGGALFVYLLVLSSMLGEKTSTYLTPSLLGPKSDRSILFLYALGSGGLATLVTAGIARVMSSGKA
jgi:hypothetical protein